VTECTLAGVLMSAHAPVPWAYECGVEPHQESFEVHKSRADSLLEFKAEIPLRYTRANGTVVQVEGLSIMGEFPTSNPYTRGVLVADRRWKWNRIPVIGCYNQRRRTGNVIRLGNKNDVRASLVPEVAYAPWSLNGSSPWTAEEVLRDVLRQVCGTAFDVSQANFSKSLPVEDLEFHAEEGHKAIARVLAYLPGNRIYLDERGTAIVFDATNSEATGKLIPELERAKIGGGLIRMTTFERTRPRDIHILFDREPELRLDIVEGESISTTDVKEGRRCFNVLPCPDVTLDIPAGPWGAARTVNMGTWITFDEFFAALRGKSPTFFGDSLPDLSHDIVQQLWCSPLITLLYAGGNVVADPVWDRRIKAVVTHYRQTYQIAQRWRDKMRSFRMNRVAVIDPLRGSRAPADVFSDYCVRATLKRMLDQAGQGQIQGWNVFTAGDGGDVTTTSLSSAIVARHAEAQTLDVDQGVFRINYKQNLNLDDAQVYPSAVDSIPSGDASETYLTWEYARLRTNHRLSIVFTVSQASPNDLRRFHEVVIGPKEVEGILGKKIGECSGPSWFIYVGADSARFGWSDEGGYPAELERAFGVGETKPPEKAQALNLGLPVNEEALLALAKGTACSIYASLLDRYEGSMTVALDPTLKPVGSIDGVQHVLMPDGTPVTTVRLSPNLPPMDVWSYVPDSVQRKLRGLVQPT
jgi:hypothetical protein